MKCKKLIVPKPVHVHVNVRVFFTEAALQMAGYIRYQNLLLNLKARFVHTCSRQPEILMKSRLKNMESLFFRLPKSFRPSACARQGLIQLGQCL
jgi:hypothetical protein